MATLDKFELMLESIDITIQSIDYSMNPNSRFTMRVTLEFLCDIT